MASGEQVAQFRLRFVAECRRVVRDRGVVEHGECGVQVVEARIDQLEADDRHAHHRGDLVVRPALGAKTVSRQNG